MSDDDEHDGDQSVMDSLIEKSLNDGSPPVNDIDLQK